MKAFMSTQDGFSPIRSAAWSEDAIDEAKRILAETEPAYGYHARYPGEGDSLILAEALENFLKD